MLPREICQSRTSSARGVARKGRIRVFGVDDHPLIRERIVAVINGQTEMQALEQVSNGHEGSSRLRDHEATTSEVTDESGALLVGAMVKATQLETGSRRLAVTDAAGRFAIVDLAIGSYDVLASSPNLESVVRSGVVLTVGAGPVLDFRLKGASARESVFVNAQVSGVETQSGSISSLVTSEQLHDLPLNGRNFESLISVAPSVSLLPSSLGQTTNGVANSPVHGNQANYSVSGSRPVGTAILLNNTDISEISARVAPFARLIIAITSAFLLLRSVAPLCARARRGALAADMNRFPITRLTVLAVSAALAAFWITGCQRHAKADVTISFLDPEWSSETAKRRIEFYQDPLLEFTRQTGIQVKHLPAPEGAREQLELIRRLLAQGSAGPDVYSIDIIWPGILKKDLTDLRDQFPEVVKSEDPELLGNYQVNGRLVAVPFHTNVGVLYYRTDLLRKYGFSGPPKTWDELEKMAAHIQNGERRSGKPDFWGFVWPGGASEVLTCDALEWQYAEGGGHIIENDGKISVNNPGTVRAWQRAAGWVGSISPPGVTGYRDWDSVNTFKTAERSAFLRTWASDLMLSRQTYAPINKDAGVTSLPGPAVLGGTGLSISRFSAHSQESIKLIRFLLHREQELDVARANSPPPPGPKLFALPPVLKAYSHLDQKSAGTAGKVFVRPSTVAGDKYDEVSKAYYEAAYSVLTRKVRAEDAASQLENELIRITGFRPQRSEAMNHPR